MSVLQIIGAASGLGAGDQGCADGPRAMRQEKVIDCLAQHGLKVHWEQIISLPTPDQNSLTLNDKMPLIAHWCQQISQQIAAVVREHKPFVVIGGDHSCAVGTWSGVVHALPAQQQLGLIWIDAHLDSHTPQTSESGNIHGMPVAALLGYGDPQLTQLQSTNAKIKPEHLCLIGVRSFEEDELALIKRLQVRVYFMDEIERRGLAAVLSEAKAHMEQYVDQYGISIDLDAIDPEDAPGVGSPEPNGLSAQELCAALIQFQDKIIGLEIAEYNPHRDKDQRTAKVICQILEAAFVRKI